MFASPRAGMFAVGPIVLFIIPAVFEIGGAWLVWQGIREYRGWGRIGLGALVLVDYGLVATLQPPRRNSGVWLRPVGGSSRPGRCCGGGLPTASVPTAMT
jgi:hypothetical protein